jgi:membrane associated rhomboid family serine protease
VIVIDNSANAEPGYKDYKPVITLLGCLACLVLFVGFNIDGGADEAAYRRWGAPTFADIFNGSYWGLFTSNFLHTEWWHILFNLYWFWLFGKKIEFHSNKLFYAFLILSAALIGSVCQLAVSDGSGIGLSGVGYALFGFLLISSRHDSAYKGFLSGKTIILFLFWLLLCMVLTRTGALQVANAAHIGGLLWGMLLGFVSVYRKQVWVPACIVLLVLVCAFTFFSSQSVGRLSYLAYEYHKNQQFDEAIVAYQNILKRDAANEYAKANLVQLKVYKLSILENEAESEMKYQDARKRCYEILQLDKDNEWAKTALGRLPSP